MITPNNLARHELIGLRAETANAKGTVIDETQNTITIETTKGEKKILKKGTEITFTIPSGEMVKVDGGILVSKPEDRTKKRLKKW